MAVRILSGKAIADQIKSEVAAEIADLHRKYGFTPCLVAVRVGEDPASEVYVSSKVKTAGEVGLISEHIHLPKDTSHSPLRRPARMPSMLMCSSISGHSIA